ncbi:integrase [Rhodococcus sp. ACS1]|jgi:integrase|uniref:Possible DNA integrase/recombinase n=2 Tax=Rhodococcus TaxID=1827 RepID=Q0RW69_RHOJR|nr:possible DNA integrase/recombinase [Rhodococcus jostii RHA1]PBC39207.1 integrase [Rhodococcus sp. ACS1]PBC39952.1 integrase [Rhodococcus sp. ACS1]
MTTMSVEEPRDVSAGRTAAGPSARLRPSARPPAADWPTIRQDRDAVWARLTRAPFAPDRPGKRHPNAYKTGVGLLLDWLAEQPGRTWQDRWRASGADADGRSWRHIPIAWLRDHGHPAGWLHDCFFRALYTAVAADLIRPSLTWLVTASFRGGSLVNVLAQCRDAEGFARLRALCSADPDVSPAAATRTAYRAALILAAKGGTLADVTTGDVLELLEAEADARGTSVGATHLFYRTLRTMGVFAENAPATLRELRTAGQRTPEEMIDRYGLACRPIRDLLVDYLRERQPVLDYTSLHSLAGYLGGLFWADLERHHPGIDSLHLSAAVADAWKQRLRTVPKTIRTPDGKKVQTTAARINYRECLTPVRAFYLDLAHWAVEDPARWGPWVAPCPVGSEEINRRKDKRHRKSRMDARTRERLPVLPVLVRSVDQRRKDAAAILDEARRTQPGEAFTAAGQTLIRLAPTRSAAAKIWAQDSANGERRDLGREEEHAFWTFAAVEVLRATGIRIEELSELSHHSLVQYRLPTTGEVVPLLQIAPSKTDTERLLVVSPELADVLSAIICRVRGTTGAVPLVCAYDDRERAWSPPLPLLFQRRYGYEHRAISASTIRDMLTAALAHTGLDDPTTGDPIRFTPHDFRRMFITDAILNGLPPHIAQIIAGHRDINVTLGYKAVYPDEAIQSHLAFLARRRALRPTDEYRVPTDKEWQEFLGHFERRKVSIGTCGRAFGSACIHEHACVRCSLLWPDPDQRPRLAEIRDNLAARITEANREGWLGEVEGLQVSLAAAEDKLAQIDKRTLNTGTVELGNPTLPKDS